MLNHVLINFLTLLLGIGLLGGAGFEASQPSTKDSVPNNSMAFDAGKEDLLLSLRFEPPEIDFGEESVGMARSHKVTLVNENAHRSVYLSSISGRTSSFFASFMESRVIAPLSNTSFDVVFLPIKTAIATDTLLVHTSFGEARLLVRGQGFDSPYRLKPIVGIKAPLNAMLTPEIYLYNPHERPLQIIEICSSDGEFQMELPNGLSSAPQALWEIPPLTTKQNIIRIKFLGNIAGNHSTFIRIKITAQSLNAGNASQPQSNTQNVLFIPMEFEIYSEQGMYASNPVLDFGRLTTIKPKKPIKLKIKLENSAEHSSQEEISILKSEALPPGLSFQDSDGGSLTLNTEVYNKTTKIDELLTLQTKSKENTKFGNIFTVRVRAEIFKGTLHFNHNVSIFVSGVGRSLKENETMKRTLIIRNDFEEPLAIQNVSFEAIIQKAVHIDFAKDFIQVLHPNQMIDLLYLHLKDDRTNFQTSLHILTNITDFKLPLIVCTGRLYVTTLHEPLLLPQSDYNTELNMGAIPLEEMSRDGFIVLQNLNPISVRIVKWDFKNPHGVYFHTTSMGCLRTNGLDELRANKSVVIESSNFHFCSALNEGDIIVFQIAIQSHVAESQKAILQIWTQHETITITIPFQTWVGKLEVDQEELYFKDCFPGKVCSSDLSIHSTFQNPIHITAINFTDDSIRFKSDESKKIVFALTPNAVTRLGRIYFEPALYCNNRCYLPQDEYFNYLVFPKAKGVENNNFHFDETELRRRTDLYRQMKRHFRTISFILTSWELQKVQLQAIIDIKWPKLVEEGAQKMPTIEAGKFQEHNIHITNPTGQPILLDYFLSDPVYAQQTKLSLPVEVVDMSSSCYLTDKPVFSLISPLKQPILLPPYASVDVGVRFNAPLNLTDTFCTLLHIRNNLTLYEAVWLSAKTVRSQFRFANLKPGISQTLLFEIGEKLLAGCQQEQPVIAKRLLTARNTGEVPIRIDLFMIEDEVCEGYGFKVFGCGNSFELKANEARQIEIAFQPDFTLFRVSRTLSILTNLSYDINYTLFGELKSVEMLWQCTEFMPRPTWEKKIRISGVFILLTSFAIVLVAANLDADNIRNTQSALYAAREKGAVQPTFNLRNIAIKSNPATSKCVSKAIPNSNQQTQRSHSKIQSNISGQHQNKSTRRRAAALSQTQRKFSAMSESGTHDGSGLKTSFDLDFDESNSLEDSNDCSPSSSLDSSTLKLSLSPPKSAEERVKSDMQQIGKKQKTSAIGKSRNSNRKTKSSQMTSPRTKNPIMELMDKDVAEVGALKCTENNPEPSLLKRSTESIAAEVSNNEKTISVEKTCIEKSPKTQRTEDRKNPSAKDDQCEVTAAKITPVLEANELKTQDKVDVTAKKSRTPPAIPDAEPPSKQKTQDISKSNLKQRVADVGVVKTTNYVGPIRNMESFQKPPQTAEAIETKPATAAVKTNLETKKRTDEAPVNLESTTLSPPFTAINSAVVKPMNLNNPESTTQQPLKYGKTPGRERSRENHQSNDPLNEQKFPISSGKISKSKVVKTLNFNQDNCSYGISTVSSNQKYCYEASLQSTAAPSITPMHVDSEKGAVYMDLMPKQTKSDGFIDDSNTIPLPPENSNTIAKSISNIFNESTAQQAQQQKGTELGPIGTKKSPSSTPVWESIVGSSMGGNMRAPLKPKVLDDSSNYFLKPPLAVQAQPDNIMARTDATNFDFNTGPSVSGNVSTASFYEFEQKRVHLQRQLEANEYLLNLRSQQLEDERRQIHQQQEFYKSFNQWPHTSTVMSNEGATWGTFGTGGSYAPSTSAVPRAFCDSTNDDKKTLAPTLEQQFDVWPTVSSSTSMANIGGTIRPPPGLGGAMSAQRGLPFQQLQHRDINNANTANNSDANLQEDGVRTYDPFSTLGSIWSDNWNQAHNQHQN